MEIKKLALRLVGLGQTKDKTPKERKGKEKEDDTSSQIGTIIHHARPVRSRNGAHKRAAITSDEMHISADDQDICLFFSRLPLEIRQQIYREIWKGYLESSCRQIPMPVPQRVSVAGSRASMTSRVSSASLPPPQPIISRPPSLFSTDLGLHIYTDGGRDTKLGHTLCRVHDCAPDHGEQNRFSMQPWMEQEDSPRPPMWLWRAWVMRQHWNRHWKCQTAVMRRWNPDTGNMQEFERSPFMPMFLTCKKM